MKAGAFLGELKRRNVLRAGVLYAGAAWALSQGIAQLGPLFDAPNWAMRAFVIACVIGFPFWIAFAWIYEFTPQGIKRESEVVPDESITHRTGRKLDFAIIGVLVVAVALLASGYFVKRGMPTGATAASARFNPPADTLVVLPFKNLSGDPKQQYFSDGITEELTGALGQNPALRVIAWDTASKYRNTGESARAIGAALNVANVLHGSIEREGGQVRIVVELVNAVTGYELWSQHYDDSFANIFQVQDQVSQAIAEALKVKFAQADLPAGGTHSPEAHELVLKGRALMDKADAASFAAARRDFEQAIQLDPRYAEAHAQLAHALIDLTEHSDLPLVAKLPTIRAEAEKALALDPRDADAWVALGNADANADPPDFAKAREEYRKALALDPSNAAAHLDYGNVLPLKAALAEYREATLLDPAHTTAWNNLAVSAQDLGDWAQEIRAVEAMLRLDPEDVDSAFYLAFAYQQWHQNDKIESAFSAVKPATDLDRQQVAAGRLTYRALADPKLRPEALAALKDLSRHQSNQDVAGNLLQLYLALGETAPALQLLEISCPATPVGCSDLAINPMYVALRTDPRFQKLAKQYTTATLAAPASAGSE
ncbi:MAG: tetratricopeptide repeat protein [Gammaproteobacteria bacterium]